MQPSSPLNLPTHHSSPGALLRNILLASAASLTYFFGMLRFFPYWNMFWILSDEGFNLIKALLVFKGFNLYSQIWSDQPPFFTHLLATQFQIFGLNVHTSRVLVLFLSSLMVWAVFMYLSYSWSTGAAVLGTIFLILLPAYPVLSVAVLVGQPSLVFACFALLCITFWHIHGKSVWLLLSGAALAFSVLTKLFTGILAPLFVLGVLVAAVQTGSKPILWKKAIRPSLIWSLAFAGTCLVILILQASPASLLQLTQPHLAASTTQGLPSDEHIYTIHDHLKSAWMYLPGLVAGLVYLFSQKRWLLLYSLGWMAAAYLLLLFHQPVWWHHQLLITIPASMIAAAGGWQGLQELLTWLRYRTWPAPYWPAAALGMVGVLLVVSFRGPDLLGLANKSLELEPKQPGVSSEDRIMSKIGLFASQTQWMVTDLPMFAFRSGIPVPPELAVISWKRFASGNLSDTEILDTVITYRPEQVLIGRFEFPILAQYLRENYRVIYERENLKLYVLKTLQQQ